MTVDFPFGLLLVLPWLGVVVAALLYEAARPILLGCWFLTAAGLAALWLLQPHATIDLGAMVAVPGQGAFHAEWMWRAEPVTLTWSAAIAVGMALALLFGGEQALRPTTLLLVSGAAAATISQWLSADLVLAWISQSIASVLAFLALEKSDDGGLAARRWATINLLSDAARVMLVVVLLTSMTAKFGWNTTEQVEHVGRMVNPLPAAIGLQLLIATLAPLGWWPLNDWCHDQQTPMNRIVLGVVLVPAGMFWLIAGREWINAGASTQSAAQGLAWLTTLFSGWFSLSARDADVARQWIVAGVCGMFGAALLVSPDFAAASGRAAMGLFVVVFAAAYWRADPWFGVALVLLPVLLALLTQDAEMAGPVDRPVMHGAWIAAALLLNCAAVRQSTWSGPAMRRSLLLAVLIAVPAVVDQLGVLHGASSLEVSPWLGAVSLMVLCVPFLSRWVPPAAVAPFVQLGATRLHLAAGTLLLIGLPLRAVAQLARFGEWFVVEHLGYRGLSAFVRHGGAELQAYHEEQTWFSLSTSILITGIWLAALVWLARQAFVMS